MFDSTKPKGIRNAHPRTRRLPRQSLRGLPGPCHQGHAPEGDAGAVLILAMVFLVAVSLIVGGLTVWTTNDLQNTSSFRASASVSASATNAVNLAIQDIRYTPLLFTTQSGQTVDQTLNASPPSYCWGSSASQQFGMNVYCTTVWNPTSASTRVVTITACPETRTLPTTGAASWTAAQSTCPQNPYLQAIVTFDDYPPPPAVSAPSYVPCVVYCGSQLTVNSWNWNPTIPQVTKVSGLAGNIDGGQPIQIQGTGFTSQSTVNFVIENPLAQTSSTTSQPITQIVAATNVHVNVATQTITASSPSVTTLTNYYVTVTSPGVGSSLVLQSASFVYSAKTPAVTALTPTSGYTTHGTAITLTGSGFLNGATVSMVQESNGTVVSPLNSGAATAVEVLSNTEITAITYPFTVVGQSFYVVVTVPSGGASPYTSSAVFTFTTAPP